MTCYLRLSNGGRLKITPFIGGYLKLSPCEDQIAGDSEYYHNLRIAEANKLLREAKKQEKIKQEEVIRMRLEAQNLLIQKREIERLNTKQAERQIRAIEKEMLRLKNDIIYQMQMLEKLKIESEKRRRNFNFIIMATCNPFSAIC